MQFTRSHSQNATLVSRESLDSLDVVWVKRFFTENSPDKGKNQYLQQLQSFAHLFQELLPLFSILDLLENLPMSQQALISGHKISETFLLI
jgi:hypothetical protein